MSLFQYLRKATVPFMLAGALVGGSVNSGLSQDSLETRIEQKNEEYPLENTKILVATPREIELNKCRVKITKEQQQIINKIKSEVEKYPKKLNIVYFFETDGSLIHHTIYTKKFDLKDKTIEIRYDGSSLEYKQDNKSIFIDYGCDGINTLDEYAGYSYRKYKFSFPSDIELKRYNDEEYFQLLEKIVEIESDIQKEIKNGNATSLEKIGKTYNLSIELFLYLENSEKGKKEPILKPEYSWLSLSINSGLGENYATTIYQILENAGFLEEATDHVLKKSSEKTGSFHLTYNKSNGWKIN